MSKMYLPSDLINSSYNYEYTNDYIVVHKYTNRHQDQWGNWSSDCVRVYPNFDYNVSKVYSCSESFTTYLTKEDFTSDFYYRIDIFKHTYFSFLYTLLNKCTKHNTNNIIILKINNNFI